MRSTSVARRGDSGSTPIGPIPVAGGFTTPAPLPGLYSVGGAMAATGAALEWFGSEILRGTTSIDDLPREADAVEPGAEGLVFLPYLAGERSPLWDPTARGAFVGLTPAPRPRRTWSARSSRPPRWRSATSRADA